MFWEGLPVGRIPKQPGIPWPPELVVGVNFDQRPQHPDHKGICADLDKCSWRFKVAGWASGPL